MSNPGIARRKSTLEFFLYLCPAFIAFIGLKLWPLGYTAVLSFASWNFIGPLHWLGFKNYLGIFRRAEFLASLVNTLWYILALIPAFLVLPLLLAVLLTSVKREKTRDGYKALLFLPTILALSIVSLVWMWIFNPSFGFLNAILSLLGFPRQLWLSDSHTALLSIVLVSGWKFMGAHLILFYAGLMAIPRDCIEAAKIDGASPWQLFWSVKWPLLAPTTVYIVLTSVIFAAERAFIPIEVLTQGGPANATTNLAHMIYRFGFQYFNAGLASASAVFTALLFLVITFSLYRLVKGYDSHA